MPLPTNLIGHEVVKARSPRRKPWFAKRLRQLSRETAAANIELLPPLRGKHNPWADSQGLVLSMYLWVATRTGPDLRNLNRRAQRKPRNRFSQTNQHICGTMWFRGEEFRRPSLRFIRVIRPIRGCATERMFQPRMTQISRITKHQSLVFLNTISVSQRNPWSFPRENGVWIQ